MSTQAHPTPEHGLCCLSLWRLYGPSRLCPHTMAGKIPFNQVVRTLLRQGTPFPSPIHRLSGTADELKKVSADRDWFVVFTTLKGEQKTNKFYSLAGFNGAIGCIELKNPFQCDVEWVKVKELRYVLICKETKTIFQAQCWASPALLETKISGVENVTETDGVPLATTTRLA